MARSAARPAAAGAPALHEHGGGLLCPMWGKRRRRGGSLFHVKHTDGDDPPRPGERRGCDAPSCFHEQGVAGASPFPGSVGKAAASSASRITGIAARKRLRALTKPTTAKIALIYKKSEAIFASGGGFAEPYGIVKSSRPWRQILPLAKFPRQLHLHPAVTYVYVSSLGCKCSFLVLRAFSTL